MLRTYTKRASTSMRTYVRENNIGVCPSQCALPNLTIGVLKVRRVPNVKPPSLISQNYDDSSSRIMYCCSEYYNKTNNTTFLNLINAVY